ncbi:hypothetical protein HK100_002103 [Physocladia obscura]|uniref:Uncharacterized protein n=1 Tax=Physocladia obscura TaxID=109957 RepID=A0AAD5SYY5_9FUNG|nr:hypothetical protein HK100_002103 [Physocladia obscura]
MWAKQLLEGNLNPIPIVKALPKSQKFSTSSNFRKDHFIIVDFHVPRSPTTTKQLAGSSLS